jgi:hypothetical protein
MDFVMNQGTVDVVDVLMNKVTVIKWILYLSCLCDLVVADLVNFLCVCSFT